MDASRNQNNLSSLTQCPNTAAYTCSASGPGTAIGETSGAMISTRMLRFGGDAARPHQHVVIRDRKSEE